MQSPLSPCDGSALITPPHLCVSLKESRKLLDQETRSKDFYEDTAPSFHIRWILPFSALNLSILLLFFSASKIKWKVSQKREEVSNKTKLQKSTRKVVRVCVCGCHIVERLWWPLRFCSSMARYPSPNNAGLLSTLFNSFESLLSMQFLSIEFSWA